MKSVEQFFSEYDHLKTTCTEAELEAWMIEQCETAVQECPDNGRTIGAFYNELGSFYKHRGRLKKAEEAFLRAKVATEPYRDINYATILNDLAGNYRLQGNYDEAIALFQQAIKVYQNHPETPKHIFSSAYNNLALVYLDTGKNREAAGMLEAAYDHMKDLPGCYYEKATAFANMAIAYYKCEEYDPAEEKMKMADELYQRGGLENTPEYQAFLRMRKMLKKQ